MKVLIFTLLVLYACISYADDMQQYLRETDQLVVSGKYKEALERSIWFHNHALEHEPYGMYGVRLSFALSSWHELGKKYPPALVALKEIRDNKTDMLVSGKVIREIFHDVLAINRTLNIKEETFALFRILDKEQPDFAKICWSLVRDDIIEQHDEYLINKYIGDLIQEYNAVEKELKSLMATSVTDDESQKEMLLNAYKNRFLNRTQQLIELAVEKNNSDVAVQIKDKANKVAKEYHLQNVSFK